MSLPIPAEIIDDDRLAQALREAFKPVQSFNFGAEARKEAKRVERPVGELDATLIVGDLKLNFSLSVYGTLQPHMAGDREQPEEREFIEIDRVILSSGPDSQVDIYDALSWADLQDLSDKYLEGQ